MVFQKTKICLCKNRGLTQNKRNMQVWHSNRPLSESLVGMLHSLKGKSFSRRPHFVVPTHPNLLFWSSNYSLVDGSRYLWNARVVFVVVWRVVVKVRWRIWDTSSCCVACYSQLLVHLRFFQPLVFSSAVLEPYFHLRFCQVEASSQFESPRASNVLVLVKFELEFQGLLTRKGSSLSPCLTLFSFASLRS